MPRNLNGKHSMSQDVPMSFPFLDPIPTSAASAIEFGFLGSRNLETQDKLLADYFP